jgi:hypothetical protein
MVDSFSFRLSDVIGLGVGAGAGVLIHLAVSKLNVSCQRILLTR